MKDIHLLLIDIGDKTDIAIIKCDLRNLIKSFSPNNNSLEVRKKGTSYHVSPRQGSIKYIFDETEDQKIIEYGPDSILIETDESNFYFYSKPLSNQIFLTI